MSPFYLVKRTYYGEAGQEDDWKVISAQELKDGRHALNEHNAHVPITIEGGKVTIHLEEARGDVHEVAVEGMGDDWTIADRGPVTEAILEPEDDDTALHFLHRDGVSVLVEKHDDSSWMSRERMA